MSERVRHSIHKFLRRWGGDVVRYDPVNDPDWRLAKLCDRSGAAMLLDVGANTGQFATRMLRAGIPSIVSFEPLSGPYAKLIGAARGYTQWSVAPRCALGATEGKVEMNIAGNSQSSSLLPMLRRHVEALPNSAYTGTESVQVLRLDDFVETSLAGYDGAFALKMDVQGFEGSVLDGAARTLPRVRVIYTEMSLCPLYEGSPAFIDLYARIVGLGFRCVGVTPGFIDRERWEVLQVDATFVAEGR